MAIDPRDDHIPDPVDPQDFNPNDPGNDGHTVPGSLRLEITCPQDGARGANLVPLQGRAWESPPRSLSHKIRWSSSLTGPLGRGRALRLELPIGAQTITAEVTGSSGETVSASVSIEVGRGAEVDVWIGDNGDEGGDGDI